MKSVTSFLNRLLAMAMEDQEVIFKYACYLHTWNTPLDFCLPLPTAVLLQPQVRTTCLRACSQLQAERRQCKAVRLSQYHACTVCLRHVCLSRYWGKSVGVINRV